MASVIYNGCALIPGPLMTVQDNPIIGGNQTRLGNTYNIVMDGTLVSDMGSPQGGSLVGSSWGGPNNQFWIDTGYPPNEQVLVAHKLYSIESKIQALKTLF